MRVSRLVCLFALSVLSLEAVAEELRLGAWNIKKLGHGSSTDFDRVAQVIKSNFDIVAVVEVMQKSGGHPGYDELITTLGSSWAGIVTSEPRPNTNSGSAEFYAMVWRKSDIKLCDGWTDMRYADDEDDDFTREPAFACFKALAPNGGAAFDFMLAAYHARFKGGVASRIKEVGHLDDVFDDMKAARPGEKDLIIAGDFNLSSSKLADTIGRPIQTVGSVSTIKGSTISSFGKLSGNLYDHLVPFNVADTSEQLGPDVIIDVRDVATSNRAFFKTVSDHLLVVARFRVEGDDD